MSVLITGATSGIGRACAVRFARGASAANTPLRLVLTGRRAERLEAVRRELASPLVEVHTLALDVRDRAAVTAQLGEVDESAWAPRVVINNAGLALGVEPADRCSLDKWEDMVDTNVKGLLYVTHALLPGLVARARADAPATILNIGSVAGSFAYPGGNCYGGTKAFVERFSKNLRADLVGRHVRVTNVEPGLTETEFSIVRLDGDADAASSVYAGAKPMSGDDIAEACYWIASLPPHVNVNCIEMMPECQAHGPFQISRARGAA